MGNGARDYAGRGGGIGREDVTAICVTGNGLKTQEAVADAVRRPMQIIPTLKSFDAVLAQAMPAAVAARV